MKKDRILKLSLLSLLVLPVLSTSCRTSDNPETFYKDVENKLYYEITKAEAEDVFRLAMNAFTNYSGIYSEKHEWSGDSFSAKETHKDLKNGTFISHDYNGTKLGLGVKHQYIFYNPAGHDNNVYEYIYDSPEYQYFISKDNADVNLNTEVYYRDNMVENYLSFNTIEPFMKNFVLSDSSFVKFTYYATKDKSDYKVRFSTDYGADYSEMYFDKEFINEYKLYYAIDSPNHYVRRLFFKKDKGFDYTVLNKIKKNLAVSNSHNYKEIAVDWTYRPLENGNYVPISLQEMKDAIKIYDKVALNRTGVYKYLETYIEGTETTKVYNLIDFDKDQILNFCKINDAIVNNSADIYLGDSHFDVIFGKSTSCAVSPHEPVSNYNYKLGALNNPDASFKYFYDQINKIYKISILEKSNNSNTANNDLYFTLSGAIFQSTVVTDIGDNLLGTYTLAMDKADSFDEEFYNNCLEAYKNVDFKENIGL